MSLIEYLKTIVTPTLCNAVEILRIRPRNYGFAPLQLECLFPEFGRMCGYAVTAQVETVTQMRPLTGTGFYDLFEAIQASPKPAVVVLQEMVAIETMRPTVVKSWTRYLQGSEPSDLSRIAEYAMCGRYERSACITSPEANLQVMLTSASCVPQFPYTCQTR